MGTWGMVTGVECVAATRAGGWGQGPVLEGGRGRLAEGLGALLGSWAA